MGTNKLKLKEVKCIKPIAHFLSSTAQDFAAGARILQETQKIDIGTSPAPYPNSGDSGYFLLITSLELYLKLLHLIDKGTLVYGHEQDVIFEQIESNNQIYILKELSKKYPFYLNENNNLMRNDLIKKLNRAGKNFTKIRYFFDYYAAMDNCEIEQRLQDFNSCEYITDENSDIIYDWESIVAIHSVVEDLALQKISQLS